METPGLLNALLLWLTGKMAEKPWLTWVVGFVGGALFGFLLWCVGVR